jgi:hypothetical protein
VIIVKTKDKTYIVIIYWWLCIVEVNGLITGILLWLVAVSNLAAQGIIVTITGFM